jgi:GTP1/Obg family GTP-binding protein
VEFHKYPDIIKLKFLLGTNFFDHIKELSYFCKSRLKMSTHPNDDIEQIVNVLDLFDSYFELFRGDIKGYESYIESRQELINNLTKMVGESVDSMKAELTKIDENIEKIKEINRDYSNSLRITNSDAPPKHVLRDLLINHTEKIEQQILTGLFGNLIDQYL